MELDVLPVPVPDSVSQFYGDSAKRRKFTIQRSDGLDHRQDPPSSVPEIPGGLGDATIVPDSVCEYAGQETLVDIARMVGITNLVAFGDYSPMGASGLAAACGLGELGDWVDGGAAIGLGGALPVNTSGGQLVGGCPHGLGFLAEAVQEMRGEGGVLPGPAAQVAVVTNAHGPQCASMALTS